MKKLCIVVVAALLAGCFGDGALTLSGDQEKDSAAIRACNAKIQDVHMSTLDGTRAIAVSYLAGSGLDTLLGATADLHALIKSICLASKDMGMPSISIDLFEPAVDAYGNKVQGKMFTLSWEPSTLERINWENVEGWQVLELATPTNMSEFGLKSATTYCRDGIPGGYGKQLCAKFFASSAH